MNIPFDKIYVISYIKNIDKQNSIKYYLNNVWNVDFEFIYGIDSVGLKNIFNLNKIKFIGDNEDINYDIGHISCSIAHLTAVQHAYYHKYNSCLIIEDDTIFADDLHYIQCCFNNIPKYADCCRFALTDGVDKNSRNKFWHKNIHTIGAQCYSINNRKTMKTYIEVMINDFREADENILFYGKNVYTLGKPIGKDPYSEIKINKKYYK